MQQKLKKKKKKKVCPPLTPEGHGDGEQHRHWVVEEEGEFGDGAGVVEVPEAAERVAHGAHRGVCDVRIKANLLPEQSQLQWWKFLDIKKQQMGKEKKFAKF